MAIEGRLRMAMVRRPLSTAFHVSIGVTLVLVALLVFGARADASPGAYRVLLTEPYPEGPHELGAQVATFPDVATIDYADTSAATPTAAELSSYDVVVSVGDNSYLDREAWGNSLADFVDSGGVVVQAGYDSWEQAFPSGRFAGGGYAPFIPGKNGNKTTSLGEFDASSPLMQGISTLTTVDNTEPELAPGAALVAKWANGRNAIAVKGRVVTTTAWIGDDYGPGEWSGDYGRLVLNAVRTLGRQRLSVTNSNPAGGTVTGSGGISCGAVCSADFVPQTPVTLSATANKGFAFAGFSGACTGAACAVTMDSAKSVTANFAAVSFGKKVTLNKKKGTATLTVTVGAPGKLVLSGKKVKRRSKAAGKAGKVKLPIIAKGKALKTLKATGKVKVKVRLAYTPTGGASATLARKVQLKLEDR
jgi:hypothetical protein